MSIKEKVLRPERVIQFGEGGFLRGFVDWMLQIVNDSTDFNGNVVVVQPIEQGLCEKLSEQDCIYTHLSRGIEGVDTKIVDVISRCVNPYEDYDAYLKLAENPDFRFVVSNTTEAGIAYCEGDKLGDRPQKSFPAKVTALLKKRFDLKLPGFVFLPCELIDKNGESLKKIILRYADDWNLGEDFKAFVENENTFCNTLVDRINTGFPKGEELKEYAKSFKREKVSVSKLKLGLKCGGSDGLSGITANPLVGRISDKLISMGGSCVLTEVPEMFGAEHLLMKRAENEEVFQKCVSLINDFKDYFVRHGQVVYENPSPGNKKGGITTLEEKSLGCVQKGGLSKVVDVLNYGDTLSKNGLSLLNGPGNDIVAVTNLAAAGVHIILFTTGRGTPLGSVVPTVKISTNETLATKKSNWIDFDASPTLSGNDLTDEFFDFIIEVAEGKETKNEENNCREISIFKDGVTL